MELYTFQLSKRKKVPEDVECIDTTIKSGDRRLSPVWEMVMAVKLYQRLLIEGKTPEEAEATEGTLTFDAFRTRYVQMLKISFRKHNGFWRELCQKDKVALGCYCNLETKEYPFCHRLILKEYITHVCKHNNIPVVDKGDFT